MSNLSGNRYARYLDRISTKQQISLLLAMLIAGVSLVTVVAMTAVNLIRGEILHLSNETSPTQVRLAKLQRGFEKINGDFARISLAASPADLAVVDSTLDKTLDEVRSIGAQLFPSAGSRLAVIEDMRRTGAELSRAAFEKIEAQSQIQDAAGKVTIEIGTVTAMTRTLSLSMSDLRTASHRALLSSKETNFEANSGIHLLLIEREQLARLRACVRETASVNEKFRLTVLRAKADSILDTMISNSGSGTLSAEMRVFVDRFVGSFSGSDGLLAARAAMLARLSDNDARTHYESLQNDLTQSIDALSDRTAGEIDPLDLTVLQTNAGMDQAIDLSARVSSVSTTVAQISERTRYIQVLAWRFLAEPDSAGVDRTVREVSGKTAEVDQGLITLTRDLSAIERSSPRSSLNSARHAFARVRQLLIGPDGVAAAVKLRIRKQQEAGDLLKTALGSIRSIAIAGEAHSSEAEAAEERSLARAKSLTLGTFFLMGFVSLAAILTGSVVGNRIRREILKSESRQIQLQNELREQTFHDPLTGLPNRLLLGTLLKQSIERASSSYTQLAIFCVDLDRFKQINDRLGHVIGDRSLIEASRRMERAIGAEGVVARMGGDEFTVLLSNTDTNKVLETARRLLAAMANPVAVESCSIPMGCSIGIAQFPRDGADADTLMKNADQAMYRAKNSGRNQFSFFDWQVSKSAQEEDEIQELLRSALKNGEFRIMYQPQFALDGHVPCLESLLRFRHPSFGDIPPTRFIPIAEESGLMVPIGDWVMREVVRQSLFWQAAGLRPVRIAVNVSALQLAQPEFFDSVRQLLDNSGLAPELLELEITETLIMSHLNETQSLIARLRALGLHVSIDDFGTGYSSLAYLHKLPVDTIKIDQSFIRDLDSGTSTLPLVEAITSAAHALGLSVVAEGVETKAQMQALIAIGCDRMQGYLFARPLAVEDAARLLGKDNIEAPALASAALSGQVAPRRPTEGSSPRSAACETSPVTRPPLFGAAV
jgi:diguanylate cyclase (GGDEF)-like protein